MDWHKLQHTLFEMDPTDPREDLAKLKAQAGGQPQESVEVAREYVQESVEIPEGSLELDRDYSVADFAALAGVTLTESQKKGSAGQAKGKDPMPKTSKPSHTGEQPHPLKDKLVGEDEDNFSSRARDAFKQGWDNYNKLTLGHDVNPLKKGSTSKKSEPKQKIQPAKRPKPHDWKRFLQTHTAALQKIAADPMKRKQFDSFMAKMGESIDEAPKEKPIKARDPNAQYMNNLRKSGAMGAHKDKKKDAKAGKMKHKGQQFETIKDMLYAKLAEKK